MTVRVLHPEEAALREAARVLHEGGLVAFPTETVYGLGAHALDVAAVQRIFSAKGRPSDNPLIVHVADVAAARKLASHWTPEAERLAAAHWPGPLTLVVEKADAVPGIVTAGGNTIGLRVPDHPVAQALLRASGLPIAAPSANRSESVSPTTAGHVVDSLGDWVDDLLILDGGPCTVGIESTVVDVTGAERRVLRPGMLQIDSVDALPPGAGDLDVGSGPARSPGQRIRHYAPSKPLRIVDPPALSSEQRAGSAVLDLPDDPARAAVVLYAELRRLEADPTVRCILVARPPGDASWDGIRDRLRRASSR